LTTIPEEGQEGFTTIWVKPSMFIDDPRDLPRFGRQVVREADRLIG